LGYYCTKCKVSHYSGKNFDDHKKFAGQKPKAKRSNPKTKVKRRSVMEQFKEQKVLLEKIGKTVTKPMSFMRKLKDLESKVLELQKTNVLLENELVRVNKERYQKDIPEGSGDNQEIE
jgi:hypothetical protein